MATQPLLNPSSDACEGTAWLECPQKLIRGQEDRLLMLALPLVEKCGLTLDMSQVGELDAAGIGTLVFLWQCAERAGRPFALVNPSRRVLQLLALVHLDDILIDHHTAA
jgi:anti-anti-sigma factor